MSGAAFLSHLAGAGFCGSSLALAALLLRRLRWFPRRALPALWGMVLFRLLYVGTLRSPLSAWGLLASDPGRRAAVDRMMGTASPADGFQWMPLWLAGAAGAACILAALWRASMRPLRVAIPLGAAERAALPVAVPGRVCVCTCEGLATPLTCGILRPRIVLPASMERGGALARHVLLHELGHIRGGHNLLKVLALCAACLHWMNPLAWAAVAALGRDLELCCDESVLRRVGGEGRRGYALSLLSLAGGGRRCCVFSSGFGRTAVERRIEGIVHYRRRGRAAFAAACALSAAILLTLGATQTTALWGGSGSVATERAPLWDQSDAAAEYGVQIVAGEELSSVAVGTVIVTSDVLSAAAGAAQNAAASIAANSAEGDEAAGRVASRFVAGEDAFAYATEQIAVEEAA